MSNEDHREFAAGVLSGLMIALFLSAWLIPVNSFLRSASDEEIYQEHQRRIKEAKERIESLKKFAIRGEAR